MPFGALLYQWNKRNVADSECEEFSFEKPFKRHRSFEYGKGNALNSRIWDKLSVVRYLDSAKCEETEKNITELQLQLAGIEERLKTHEAAVCTQKQAIETQRERIHTLSGTVRELIRQVGLIEADYSIVDTIREEEA